MSQLELPPSFLNLNGFTRWQRRMRTNFFNYGFSIKSSDSRYTQKHVVPHIKKQVNNVEPDSALL